MKFEGLRAARPPVELSVHRDSFPELIIAAPVHVRATCDDQPSRSTASAARHVKRHCRPDGA
jgi:hypothetical protein